MSFTHYDDVAAFSLLLTLVILFFNYLSPYDTINLVRRRRRVSFTGLGGKFSP